MANSVDPHDTAHNEPSHLYLHRLQKYLSWSTRLKGFKITSDTKACFSSKFDYRAIIRNLLSKWKAGNEIQTTLFIPTLDTTTKFVIMTY